MALSIRDRFNNGLKSASAVAPFIGINDPRYSQFMGINTNQDFMAQTALGRIQIAKQAVWVYACIIARSNVLKDVPLKLYTRDDRGVKTEIRNHPIVALLQDVNPVKDTPATIRTATEQSMCIHGVYYWKKVRNKEGVVKEIYGLPAQFTSINTDNLWITKFIYEYGTGRNRVVEEYVPDDIVYFRYHDFDDGAHGLSPLSVAIQTTQADLGIITSQNAMLNNAGRPSVVITMPNKLNDADYARENERVQRSYAGSTAAGKIWLIDNAQDTKVTPVQLSPRELEWIAQHRSHIKDICSAFAVTPGMVGEFADASRLANAGAMHRFYGETFVRPELQLWEDTLNWQLLWTEDWGHGIGWERAHGMFLEHDLSGVSMFREDENARSKRAQTAFMTGASIDETLQMNGLNPIGGEEGNARLIASNLVPLSSVIKITGNAPDSSMVETAAEYEGESGKTPAVIKHEESTSKTGSKFTDATESDDMTYAKALERKQFKKWAKKHNLKSDNFDFNFLDEDEQEDLLHSASRMSVDLEVEIRSTLARVADALKVEPVVQPTQQPNNVTVNFPQITVPVTANMPAPMIEVKSAEQQVPQVHVTVQPTPIQVTNNMPEMNVSVEPTPVTIENQVNPTPVNVSNTGVAPIVNVTNNVPTTPVHVTMTPRTDVVERDDQGRIKTIRHETEVEEE